MVPLDDSIEPKIHFALCFHFSANIRSNVNMRTIIQGQLEQRIFCLFQLRVLQWVRPITVSKWHRIKVFWNRKYSDQFYTFWDRSLKNFFSSRKWNACWSEWRSRWTCFKWKSTHTKAETQSHQVEVKCCQVQSSVG